MCRGAEREAMEKKEIGRETRGGEGEREEKGKKGRGKGRGRKDTGVKDLLARADSTSGYVIPKGSQQQSWIMKSLEVSTESHMYCKTLCTARPACVVNEKDRTT